MPTHDPAHAALGRAIRRIRQDRNLTIEDLALEIGMAVSTIGQIERGKSSPRFGTLCRIAHTLGVGLASLTGDPLLVPGERRLTPEEFEQHFGHLPTDGEG